MSDAATGKAPQRNRHFAGPAGRMIPTERARDPRGTAKKLIAFMGRYKLMFGIAFVFAVGSTIFSIVGPKVLSMATTELFEGIVAKVDGSGGIDFSAIARILIATLALYALSAACSFVQGWCLTYVSQRTCFELRREIAAKINRLPVGYFERTSVGDTLSRITNDVDTISQNLNQGISQLVTSTVTLVGVVVMMVAINVWMTLVALAIIPVSLVLIRAIVKRSQKHFYRQQDDLGCIDGMIEETFSGHTIVKAFNREADAVAAFDEASTRLRESAWRSQFLSGLMRPAMDLVGNLAYVAVAIMGGVFAAHGAITVGDIQAFIQYVKNFTQPITQLAQVSNVFQQTAAAAERVFEFLDEAVEPQGGARLDAAHLETSVEFDCVRFGYDPSKPVIDGFTARVKAGQTVAIVGPTGAGKTTMVKLLMRFYDVQGGAIRIGGCDTRDFDRTEVRALFGMVLQDAWLFHGTVRENIRYGNPDASDEDVRHAAERAHAHHFIEALPGGYDCVINEDGSNISQGQRQLITIARAFLADRRMLILDEATSSVDTRTERRIQRAMDDLARDRTAFVIAHRLSTVQNADLILVMRDGGIVEQGTHDELLALDGFYAELYNSQFAYAAGATDR